MVKSYFNEELENVVFDSDTQEEWSKLASNLGLESQLSFIKKADSPMPYPFMNKSLVHIFETLCPVKVDYTRYDKTPIPLEVLRELSFCVNEKYFEEIEIWYDDKTPDPIAVGHIKRYLCKYHLPHNVSTQYTSYSFLSEAEAKEWAEINSYIYEGSWSEKNPYLIARWADENHPLETLKMMAYMRLKEKYTNEWNMAIKNLQTQIQRGDEILHSYLAGEISEWELRTNLR